MLTKIELSPDLRLFMVCDGRGNPFFQHDPFHREDQANSAVEYVIRHLHLALAINLTALENMDNEDMIAKTLVTTFLQLDDEMKQKNIQFGTTCNMVIVDQLRHTLYHANLGDSRMLAVQQDKIIFESKDHNVQDQDEVKRVIAAGGYIFRETHIVVAPDHQNAIGLSRAFGDFKHKFNNGVYDPINGVLCAVPTVSILKYTPNTTLLLMSDAVFGCPSKMTSQQVVNTYLGIPSQYRRIRRCRCTKTLHAVLSCHKNYR